MDGRGRMRDECTQLKGGKRIGGTVARDIPDTGHYCGLANELDQKYGINLISIFGNRLHGAATESKTADYARD